MFKIPYEPSLFDAIEQSFLKLGQSTGVRSVGRAVLDGRAVTEVQFDVLLPQSQSGSAVSAVLAPLAGKMLTGTAWIDPATKQLLKAQYSVRSSTGPPILGFELEIPQNDLEDARQFPSSSFTFIPPVGTKVIEGRLSDLLRAITPTPQSSQ